MPAQLMATQIGHNHVQAATTPGPSCTHVDEQHSDLLVVGAYHRPEWIKWLVNDTTRHVIVHLDLPLLLDS